MKKHAIPGTSENMRRLAAARENGSRGGEGRASRHRASDLSRWAAQGGMAVLAKYGQEYFRELRKRRKQYPKQDPPALPTIPPAVLSGRQNGRRDGLARAKRHTREKLKQWARRGGIATRKRYGKTFYREIRKLRTYYPSGYLAEKTKQRIKKETKGLMKSLAQSEEGHFSRGMT